MQHSHLAIVAAIDDEIKDIRNELDVDSKIHIRPMLVETGKFRGNKISLVRSGMGKANMQATALYIANQIKPDFVLHVGYCGACSPDLAAGDLVVCSECIDAETGDCFKANSNHLEKGIGLIKINSMRGIAGSIVTVDKIISSPHEKAFLGTHHHAQALDMESSVLAKVCEESALPYLIVRSVFDPLDVSIPNLSDAVDETGAPDGGAFVEHVVRKPSDLLKIPKMAFLAQSARESINNFVYAWVG